MKLPIDYQWPYLQNYSIKNSSSSLIFRRDILEQIESFFEKKYNCHALLFPSGRAGLSAIMLYQKTNRSDIVFTSKWSSKCVFDVICNYANPSVIFGEEVSQLLIVHKWGKIYRANNSSLNQRLIIEDSVDSFIRDESGLFPNEGSFELLSLPKLVGGYCGGVILTRDRAFFDFAKSLQGKKMDLARFQSQLKQGKKIDNAPFINWAETEIQNFSLTEEDLLMIQDQVGHWENCQKIILQRLAQLREKVNPQDFIHDENKRLGPVLPLDTARYSLGEIEGVMKRNFSSEPNISKLNFKPHLIIPLHFGIDDASFNYFVENLIQVDRGK
ncbi:MAG: hypothetical protein WC635_15990 [Bacteriovorax sp.]|jgi:putative PLP-dependent aminotransferase (TIGR04422 family)